jgi:lipopolysaccharide transport system ATP-binding protein
VVAVEVENVSKRFRRQTVQPATSLKSTIVDFITHRRRPEREGTFQALKGISFQVQRGQTLGIIGRNGSGKSTLLKLLAGIYRPDGGRITVHGRLGALLELGAGFHPEFSGRENILVNGIVLGLSKREVRQRFEEIVRFAELEEFIDEPVKTYSSGMYMRLGFSVAVHADPDVLLIDEILAVGDEAFHQKCFDKLAEFRRRGRTIILVSHDLAAVESWSDEAIWLEDGVIREWGTPRRTVEIYRQVMAAQEGGVPSAGHPRAEDPDRQIAARDTPSRWGGREVEIVSVRLLDASGRERQTYHSGEQMSIALSYAVHGQAKAPVFGIMILREDGVQCYGTNTAIDEVPLPPLGAAGSVEVLLERLDFVAGTYYLDVAVQAKDGQPYDYHHRLYAFTITSEHQDVGICRIPHCWTIKPLSPSSSPPAVCEEAGQPTYSPSSSTLKPPTERGKMV